MPAIESITSSPLSPLSPWASAAEVEDMGRRPNPAISQTMEVVDQLFRHPPVNDAELEARLRTAEPTLARRLMVDRLERGMVTGNLWRLIVGGLGFLGLGEEQARLTALAADRDRDPRERVYALMVISNGIPEDLLELSESLAADDAEAIMEASLFVLFFLEEGPELGRAISSTLESMPNRSAQRAMLRQIEGCRHGMGTPPAETWTAALESQRLRGIRDDILGLLIDEPERETPLFLEQLRDTSRDPKTRRAMQKALMLAMTSAIDPGRTMPATQGRAHIGSCDGQGAFVMVASFDNGDGTTTLASICIRAGGDIRDALFAPRLRESEWRELIAEFLSPGPCPFTELPLTQAAAIVRDAVDRTQTLERHIPEDAMPVVRFFERVPEQRPEPVEVGERRKISLAQTRKLLARPGLADTWYFDAGDLRGADLEPPAHGRVPANWFREATRKIDRPSYRQRLVAMCNHMALWCRWNGDDETASVFSTLAATAEVSLANHPLARVMLEVAVRHLRTSGARMTGEFGDPNLRQHLKARFFPEVETARGHDLARLDFTEIASSCLEAAFGQLPGERRPREEERENVAYAISDAFAEYTASWVEGRQVDGQCGSATGVQLDERTASVLMSVCGLNEAEAELVSSAVISGLVQFTDQMCIHCPIGCLFEPHKDFGTVFHEPRHPLALSQRSKGTPREPETAD